MPNLKSTIFFSSFRSFCRMAAEFLIPYMSLMILFKISCLSADNIFIPAFCRLLHHFSPLPYVPPAIMPRSFAARFPLSAAILPTEILFRVKAAFAENRQSVQSITLTAAKNRPQTGRPMAGNEKRHDLYDHTVFCFLLLLR